MTPSRHTLFNLLGRFAPAGLGILTVPSILHGLGPDRFGLLSLAWLLVGYFGVFDFGIGRALTQLVSERRGAGKEGDVPVVAWTALMFLTAVGVVGAIAGASVSSWVVHELLKVPDGLHREASLAFIVLSASVPFVLLTAALRGLLEAYDRFGAANALRAPMILATFVGPLLVMPTTRSLVPIALVLSAGRIVTLAGYLFACKEIFRRGQTKVAFSGTTLKRLLQFGSWATVSNVVSPIMVSLDRVIIGGQLHVASVGYYSVAQQITQQVLAVPGAYSGVLFPRFAREWSGKSHKLWLEFRFAVMWAFLLTVPPLLCAYAFADEGLALWLGTAVAKEAAPALRYLCIGALVNGIAQVPFALINGAGRPDLTARLHLAEAVPYLFLVVVLTGAMGITGTALAWTARAAIDMVALFLVAQSRLGRSLGEAWAYIGLAVGGSALLLVPGLGQSLLARTTILVALLGGIGFVAWALVWKSRGKAIPEGRNLWTSLQALI